MLSTPELMLRTGTSVANFLSTNVFTPIFRPVVNLGEGIIRLPANIRYGFISQSEIPKPVAPTAPSSNVLSNMTGETGASADLTWNSEQALSEAWRQQQEGLQAYYGEEAARLEERDRGIGSFMGNLVPIAILGVLGVVLVSDVIRGK